MQDSLDALESRIAELRRAIRGALAAHDQERVRELRTELRRAERSWDVLVTPPDRPEEERQGLSSLLPVREQVHQALTLLGVPATPKLAGTVHSAFFAGELAPSGLASLRRDEERSYRSAPGARPYYLCPALTSDLLSPARALVCISTWPLEHRVIGPLSPRVDFLTSAIRIAEATAALGGAGHDCRSRTPAAPVRVEHPRRGPGPAGGSGDAGHGRGGGQGRARHPRRPRQRRPGTGGVAREAPTRRRRTAFRSSP